VVAFLPVFIAFGLARLIVGDAAGAGSKVLYASLTALWALHWIVIDALDSAQTLAPDETLADANRRALAAPEPWFVRALRRLRWSRSARLFNRYSTFWREECELIEHNPVLALGFGLATAGLLAIPGLNLFFRPITIIAAVHLAGVVESIPGERFEQDQS